MTRKEKFAQTIEAAWSEEKRKRLAPLSLAEWWTAIRDDFVNPILEEAASALKDSALFGEQTPKNGGSGTILQAGSLDSSSRYNLTFTQSADGIMVSSSESALNESWDREYVTEEVVTAKVKQFLQKVAAKCPAPKLTRGIW
jgi:hypothetical protein